MISSALSSGIDAVKGSTPGSRDMDDHPISRDALGTIGRGQWVRDRLLDAHPEFRTNFNDYDGDGVVGNIEDFIRYYEKNHEIIEKNIPFFKWAASMDPPNWDIYNPTHDYLSLAYDDDPASDVKQTYGLMGSVISDVRQFHGASSVQTIVTLLQQKFASVQKSSFLLLGAAYQFGLVEEADGLMSIPRGNEPVRDVTVDELYGDFYADHGRMLEEYGNFERARSHYADALFLDPSLQSNYHRLGRVLHDLDRYKDAIGVYEAALKRDPYDANALAGRGAAYLALKNTRAAQADFREAVQFDPTHAPAHVGLGRIQHIKKNHKEARKHYTDAIKADPSSAMGFYWRAIAWDDDKRPKKAMKDYIRAIKRDRSLGDAFHGLALIQHDAGYYEYAYRNLWAAIRRDPSNPLIYKDLGLLQQDRKKPKGALWAFNKALELKPKLASALIARGSLRHDQKQYLDAQEDYVKAVAAIDPKDAKMKAEVFRNLGFLYADMSMPKLAYESFLKVTVLDPRNPRAWCELGEILSKPEHGSKLAKAVGTNLDLAALRAFKDAMKLDKKYVKAYHGTAMAWLRLGQYAKALENLNRCLDIDRHNADTLYIRSKVHDKLGNYGSASKDRMDACRIKPALCERK